jgi:hypothetical protein
MLVVVAGACGDDSRPATSAGPPTDAELESFVHGFMSSSGGIVTQRAARCIGEELLPELSPGGKRRLNASDSDIGDLSASDQDAMYDAFDRCIELRTLAASIASGMTTGPDATAGDAADCVAGKIVESYEGSGALMRELLDTSGDQSKFTELLVACQVGGSSGATP